MKEHLMTEKDMQKFCLYCSKKHKELEWNSEFYREVHYKVIECDCGKISRVKAEFLGSGHDCWNEKNSPPQEKLEKKIKILEKIRIIS